MDNPFVFDRPNNIEVEEFIQFFIQDNTYTRFLESTRNILLIGVRGSGKTSTLRYYSYPITINNPNVKEPDKEKVIGIHIPSKHPLFGKKEYLLYEDDNKKYIVIEHFLSLNILSSICQTFNKVFDHLDLSKETTENIISNIGFILDLDIKPNDYENLFVTINRYFKKESLTSQKRLNSENFDSFIEYSFSFHNTVVPILEELRIIKKLQNSHFSLLFDDLQDLDKIHRQIINSWIAYRDNSLFSIKIATAEIKPNLSTSKGGVILEGHDFIRIDLTKRIFNKNSEFSNFAREVVQRRLKLFNIKVTVDEFIPLSENFAKGLEESRKVARELAQLKYPKPEGTQISDFISKYGRAIYFRNRLPKANKPVYSGFETIVDVSTGVIRNLLNPLYYMYEKEVSKEQSTEISKINPAIQKEVLISRSEEFWRKIKDIDTEIDDCPDYLGKAIHSFFNKLMSLLQRRLKDEEISEPRALNFIISRKEDSYNAEIDEIIDFCLRSTLLYKRLVNHKSKTEKLELYIPNRLMLPAFGLDPHGQYSHFSITAKDFYNAAYRNKEIPYFNEKDDENQISLGF